MTRLKPLQKPKKPLLFGPVGRKSSLEIFEGNMRSRSYALTPDDPAYADFSAELRSVFEQYAVNGIVTDPQETQIYLGRF